jgi:hypothetical protein
VPAKQQDIEAQVRRIALDVASRRKAGETIPDEEVLRQHPQLRGPLLEQLSRLSPPNTALDRGDGRSKVDGGGEPLLPSGEVSTDHQGTLDLPLFADESSSEVIAADEQLPKTATPQHPAGDVKKETTQRGSELALTEEAPPESGTPLDHLRITLKEPGPDVRNQSTMVLDESSFAPPLPVESRVPLYRPTVRAPMAVLKLFHDGQTTYNSYPIMTERFRIGRNDGDLIVPHDFWMSGKHAEIQRRKRGDRYHWYLVDLKSTNGTFVQADFAVLKNNDELFIGQERYRFLLQDGKAGLMHVTRGAGQQWLITDTSAVIGSRAPCGLKSFASDPYLDEVHARLKREPDGTWTIRDNRSRNGIWFRITEVEIPPNAEFQLGEQRFGFWTSADQPVKAAHLRVASKASDEKP